MSASSLSMAAAQAVAVSSSSFLSNKLSCSLTPLPKTHFTSKRIRITTKPSFKLIKHQNPISFLNHFRCFVSSFDDTEEASNDSSGDDEPQTQDYEKQNLVDEQEEEEDVSSNGSDGGRLYVGNLPFSMTSSQLSQVFGEAGRVVNVEIVYDRVTDRSRGFAFVTMGSVQEAEEAIRMFEGTQIGGRTVKVNFPEVPRGGERTVMGARIRSIYQAFVDSPHKIYAGNLGWGLTSEGLREAFADQPGVLSAKVIYDRNSGRSRGFGFVSFETAESAESALNAMNGVEVEGRPLRLNRATERAPVTPPPAPESDSENGLDSSELLSNMSA